MKAISRFCRFSAQLLSLFLTVALALPSWSEEPAIAPLPQEGQPEQASPSLVPVVPPVTAPLQEKDSGPAVDPCKDVKEELRKLKSRKKAASRKVRKKKSGTRRKKHHLTMKRALIVKAEKKDSSSIPAPSPFCYGAMPLAGVKEVLASTRDFSGKNLNCLDLAGYDLHSVNFSGSTLRQAILARANMESANFERADLTDADMRQSTLHLARLAETILTNAQLDGALWIDRQPCAPGSVGRCRDIFQKTSEKEEHHVVK